MKGFIDGEIVAHEKQKKMEKTQRHFKKSDGNFKPDFGEYSELVQ